MGVRMGALATVHRLHEPRRVAVLSIHTSPLDQPGTGDAGGMNVYVVETARRLAESGVEVEIFTRATSSALPPLVELSPGVTVRHVTAGPFEGLLKQDLPGQLCAVTAGVMRAEAARPERLVRRHPLALLALRPGRLAGLRAVERPARALHAHDGQGQEPRPGGGGPPGAGARVIGEQQVVEAADRLVANTTDEAGELVELLRRRPAAGGRRRPGGRPRPVPPRRSRSEARRRRPRARGCARRPFVGRIQPLKAPDILVRAAAEMVAVDPQRRPVPARGAVAHPARASTSRPLDRPGPRARHRRLVRFEPPSAGGPRRLGTARPTWWPYRATPNRSGWWRSKPRRAGPRSWPRPSAACSPPSRDQVSGLLVEGHNPADFASAIARITSQPRLRATLAAGAHMHAAAFGWAATTAGPPEQLLRGDRQRAREQSRRNEPLMPPVEPAEVIRDVSRRRRTSRGRPEHRAPSSSPCRGRRS